MITTDFANQFYTPASGGKLKKTAQNALYLASESRAYYPNNQEIILLSTQLEGLIKSKFPELIAKAN